MMSKLTVSILIAARNEEENLPLLLNSLLNLSYPKEELEILFGNDASSDNTGQIINEFAAQHRYMRVINLEEIEADAKLKGKTRVLEELAKRANGDYLFFTDADMELPENWVQAMLQHFEENVGVVVGLSTMKPTTYYSALQGIEWLSALHFMNLLSKVKILSTGMGNNMAVAKEAYWVTGGYAKIRFSIVEDYALYKAIIDHGYGFKQAFEPEVLAYTNPPKKFFEQRKRWMKGGFESKSPLMVPALLQALLLPVLVILAFWHLAFVFWIIFNLMVFHFLQIGFIQHKLGIKGYLKYVPLFVFYLPISWFLQLLYYFLPSKVIWKGRRY